MKNMKWINITFLFLVLTTSCSQVFEDDIENRKVTILTPRTYTDADRYDVISSALYTVSWSKMDGADEYRVRIDLIDSLGDEAYFNSIWDSTTLNTSLTIDLNTALPQNGRYYRVAVRGENSAYESNYDYAIFYRSESVDISGDEVRLSSPAKGEVVTSLTVNYQWAEFTGGNFDRYLFERLSSNGSVLSVDTVSANSISKTYLSNDVIEYWRVRAQNDISTTKAQSPIWSFVIDTTTVN